MNKFIKPPSLSTSFSESGKSAKKRFDNILNTKARKTGVLAFVLILLLVGIVGAMVACNNSNYTYINEKLGFSVEFPTSWQAKYGIEENENSIYVYHKGIREKYGEGTGLLFYIEMLNDDKLTLEQITEPGNRSIALQENGYTYVFGMPTDIQYPIWEGGDKALANEYVKLSEDSGKIKKSIKSIAVAASAPASNIKMLYGLKDTYVGDNSKVYEIVRSVNFADISMQSIELKTDNKPYAITVNYKVDSRANYRFFDYSRFNKNAAVIFCLIPNADEINFRVYDNYGAEDNPDTSFVSAYFDRRNLSERSGMEYFIDENVRNATSSIESFTEYFNKVSAVNNETFYNKDFKGNSQSTQIYHIIGDDCEIVVNSGMRNFITITKEIAANKKINKLLAPMNIKLDEYIGKKIEFLTYGIRNFKTNQDTAYLFVFDGEKLIISEDLKTWQADRTVMDILRTFADGGN